MSFSKYTVLKPDGAMLLVLYGKNHDKIIDELEKRRNQQLLLWYGDLNPNNDLAQEILKFNWLADRGVITKTEAQVKIDQAKLAHPEAQESALAATRPVH